MAAETTTWDTLPTNGWAKRFLCFLPRYAMMGTLFIFPQNMTAHSRHPFAPLPSATLQATSPFHPPTILLSLEQGTLPSAFCSLPGNEIFSLIREIRKDQTKGPWKAQGLMSTVDESTAQPGWNCFPLVTKEKHAFSPSPDGRLHIFC